jgi:hypothetical protein
MTQRLQHLPVVMIRTPQRLAGAVSAVGQPLGGLVVVIAARGVVKDGFVEDDRVYPGCVKNSHQIPNFRHVDVGTVAAC